MLLLRVNGTDSHFSGDFRVTLRSTLIPGLDAEPDPTFGLAVLARRRSVDPERTSLRALAIWKARSLRGCGEDPDGEVEFLMGEIASRIAVDVSSVGISWRAMPSSRLRRRRKAASSEENQR